MIKPFTSDEVRRIQKMTITEALTYLTDRCAQASAPMPVPLDRKEPNRTLEQKWTKQVLEAIEATERKLNGMRFTPGNNIRKLLEVAKSIARPDMHPSDVETFF